MKVKFVDRYESSLTVGKVYDATAGIGDGCYLICNDYGIRTDYPTDFFDELEEGFGQELNGLMSDLGLDRQPIPVLIERICDVQGYLRNGVHEDLVPRKELESALKMLADARTQASNADARAQRLNKDIKAYKAEEKRLKQELDTWWEERAL